jgi:hypothetical protein
VRSFFRDSLKAIAPGKGDAIAEQLVPNVGEYGLESWSCRAVCCFIFTMSVVSEVYDCMAVLNILRFLPTDDSLWIRYVPYSETSDNKAEGFLPASLLGYQMGGIPLGWKLVNFFIVFVPKCFLALSVMWEGFRFMMETAGTVPLVLGSMAMGFVLHLDEMVLSCLGTKAVEHIMDNLKDQLLFEDVTPDEDDPDDLVLEKVNKANSRCQWLKALYIGIPKRLVMLTFLFCVFTAKYYKLNCANTENSGYYSVDTHFPKSTRYTFWDYLFGELLSVRRTHTTEVVWSMPLDAMEEEAQKWNDTAFQWNATDTVGQTVDL